ncbi:hypothetical protein BDP27DRAFT_1359207 [Rhodocollybia butyracea]|uniref:Non-reducing end beta-L-arabinofuranosidase-like GH127 catalytic domain-containing protein n=1 Tax=Rhodocollybia butyracea TaxID=206335 RepID=A0A9P5Q596_9AGAR|nr:hypothetical protein BDP27DRAFT_1359207 [Rhodocollybia butyracea]
MAHLKSAFLLVLGIFSTVLGQTNITGLAPKQFLSLPLGSILPTGWLHDQLMLQTNGLAGNEHLFYDYVSDTDWIGGDSFYSTAEEGKFNGMVPNGVLANNSGIIQRTQELLDYVLANQDSTGWMGPEVNTTKPRFLWGRYPFMFGAIQMVENNPDLTDKVVAALYKFVTLANAMIKNNEGLDEWSEARWQDFVITLQWLYDFHPDGNEDLLLDTMLQLKSTGLPWELVFDPQWHGVNIAESLKAFPAAYRFTHNQSDLDNASAAWDILFQYHGRPSGIFGADEYLAGMEAVRGTELCIVVETMFSGSYLYQVTGDPKYVDRVERIAYNALPAELTGDFWSRQYLQQQNQIAAKNMNPPYSNVFGLEPNYPCCTVNHPQGWPKFITNAFVTTADQSSLAQVYLGPFQTTTTLTTGNPVTVTVNTIYPFSDSLNTTITATKAFTYYVRIPSWVVNGTISINDGSSTPLSPKNGLQAVQASAGTTVFILNLPAEVTTESRPHGSIAVHRGPLHYAFDKYVLVPRNSSVLTDNAQQPLAQDLELDATAVWQYAIDPTTLQFVNNPPTSGTLPSPVFDSGLPPLSMTVTACPIDWPEAGDTFVTSPPTNPACTGTQTTIALTPYGAAKLRISEFPVFTAQ